MNKSLLRVALAMATILPFTGAGPDRRDTQRKEHEKAQEKKRRVREQIRARKAARKGPP